MHSPLPFNFIPNYRQPVFDFKKELFAIGISREILQKHYQRALDLEQELDLLLSQALNTIINSPDLLQARACWKEYLTIFNAEYRQLIDNTISTDVRPLLDKKRQADETRNEEIFREYLKRLSRKLDSTARSSATNLILNKIYHSSLNVEKITSYVTQAYQHALAEIADNKVYDAAARHTYASERVFYTVQYALERFCTGNEFTEAEKLLKKNKKFLLASRYQELAEHLSNKLKVEKAVEMIITEKPEKSEDFFLSLPAELRKAVVSELKEHEARNSPLTPAP